MAKESYYVLYDPKKRKFWDYYSERWLVNTSHTVTVAKKWGDYEFNTVRMSSNETAMAEWFNYLEGMNAKRPRNLQILRIDKSSGTIVSKTELDADDFQSRIDLGKIKKKYPFFDADDLFSDLSQRFDSNDFKWIFSARETFNSKTLSSDGAFNKRNTRIDGNTMAVKTDEQMAVAKMLFNVIWAIDIREFTPRLG